MKNSHFLSLALFALLSLSIVSCFDPNTPGCGGVQNNNTIIHAAPVLISTVPNGKLYMATQVSPPIRVVHLWGTPYEMGFAAGQLLSKDLKVFLPGVMNYLENKGVKVLSPYVPEWVAKYILDFGINGALQLTYEWTKKFTPKHFEEEIQGMADGSGVDINLIRRLNMIPELIKAACSMIGAWGPAISKTAPGSTLYQLRALDWNIEGPFGDFPALMVYHPTGANGVPFASLGWTGFVGALTGYSSSNVGICEKWWASYNGTYFVEGYPFHYLLRDILQFDPDRSAAMNRIFNAQRTCAIHIGIGDSQTNQFRSVDYSHDSVHEYSDVSFPVYPPAHPRYKGVVFLDKHVQPSHNPCMGSLIGQSYGSLDAQNMIYIASLEKTGDNHAAIYDFGHNQIYVTSQSSPSTPPVIPAYNRPWLQFNATRLFAESHP